MNVSLTKWSHENIEIVHGNATAVDVSNKCEGEEEMKKAGVLLFMEHYWTFYHKQRKKSWVKTVFIKTFIVQ